ncbi:restriction endonuclease subunit S [Sphingobacterium thermophilum]|uniref:Restriction endonuclease subunit S n=1 Tax=Sphingobacterium thermophilum TaxID=768534 RepID=A0ABP8R5F9_9SPHI
MSTTTPHTQTAYKDTPIGKIPADWEVKKIGEIFNSFPTASYSRADLIEEGEILYLHYGDIHTKFDFHLDVSKATLPSITEEKLKKYEVVKEGDWVLCDASEDYDGVGKSVEIVNLDEKKLIAGLHTFLLREKGNFFAPYFKGYVALNESVRKQFQKLATGTKVYSLSKETLLSVKIPLPPLPEQKRIAEVLSTWDKAIQLTEQLIRQKEQRKKWLMQQLLTGKKRLKGFDRDWIKCNAADFLVQRNEQAPNNGSIPLFSLTIENGVTEKSDRYEREFLVKDKSSKNYKIVYPNDIVFNPANLRWGAIAKHIRTFKVLLSPIYEVLSVKKGYDIDFISYLVSSPRQIAYYASILEGTLIERMAVKVEPFLATNYEIPEIEEQIAIAQVLQAADKEISLLKTKAKQLKEQKKGLMQQLLTGKKRLL